jgi:broad specificity phosphatase PhoE
MSNSSDISVFLIRHGESMANAGHATSDPATIPLTPCGWTQAQQVATVFNHPPSLIITSSYLRTQQTAEPTCERFPLVPQVVWPVQEFTYLSPAHCVNMTAAQRRPLVEAYWERCDLAVTDGPGAEAFASLIERVQQMLLHIQELECGDIAIFTHGHFMQMVLWLVRHPACNWSSQEMRVWRERALSEPLLNTQIIRLKYSRGQGWSIYEAES